MKDNFDLYQYNTNIRKRALNEQVIKLDDLTLDILGDKPMFGFSFPNNDDSSSKIHNDDDLERWSDGIKSKYGNVDVSINDGKIEVLDDRFTKDKEQRTAGKDRALKDLGTNV